MKTIPRFILKEGEGVSLADTGRGRPPVRLLVRRCGMVPHGRCHKRIKTSRPSQSDTRGTGVAEAAQAEDRKIEECDRSNRLSKVENPIRILVVDDHPFIRQVLRQLFAQESDLLVVAEASDGQAAIDVARQCQPEVIIMDVNMPRLDGIEATRQIVAEHPRMQVIGFSMHDEEYWSAAMRAAGAVAYVPKQTAARELVAVIRRFVKHHRTIRPSDQKRE